MIETQNIDFKTRLRHMFYCIVVMGVLSSLIVFLDPRLNEHLYVLIIVWSVAVWSVVGMFIVRYKNKEKI